MQFSLKIQHLYSLTFCLTIYGFSSNLIGSFPENCDLLKDKNSRESCQLCHKIMHNPWQFDEELGKKNNQIIDEAIELLAQNPEKLHYYLLSQIAHHPQTKGKLPHLIKAMKNKPEQTNIFMLLSLADNDENLKSICERRLATIVPPDCQSYGHIALRKKQLITDHKRTEKYIAEIEPLMRRAGEKEALINKEGKYVLYHGLKKNLDFQTDLYTTLWAIKNHKPINDFKFLRFYDGNNELLYKKNNIPELEEQILKKGWSFNLPAHLRIYGEKRTSDMLSKNKRILFANNALSANMVGRFSFDSSMEYVSSNHNYQDPEFSSSVLFKSQGMEKLYEKYKNEIDELENLNEQIGKGRLIQIVLTKEQLQACTYTIDPLYYKVPIHVKEFGILDGNKDGALILDILRKNPELIEEQEDWQYAIILTDDYLLNPDSGIKIFVYHTGNEAQYQEYLALKENLFTRIKNDFEANEWRLKNLVPKIKVETDHPRHQFMNNEYFLVGAILGITILAQLAKNGALPTFQQIKTLVQKLRQTANHHQRAYSSKIIVPDNKNISVPAENF